MSKQRLIIPSPDEQGGSGDGWSYWKSFLGCPRAYRLDQLTTTTSVPLRTGTLVHKLMEIYYGGSFDDYVLEYQEGNTDPAWTDALRLFSAYRTHFPSTELGEVLFNERRYMTEDKKRYGVPRFSGQLDMGVRIDEAAAAILMTSRPQLGFLTPGVYNVDFKTSGRGGMQWKKEQKGSSQYTGYAMLLEDNEPELYKEFQGTLVVGLIKHVDLVLKSFPSIWIPPPGESEQKILHHALQDAGILKNLMGDDRANPTMCNDFGGCNHLIVNGGNCERF